MSTILTVVTVYRILGAPLFCNRPATPYRYHHDTPPWVALPVEEYTTGRARCGDTVLVVIDGTVHRYLALDAGPFGDNCVMQPGGECYPIVADIPQELAPFDGLSAVGWVVNGSGRSRRREMRGEKRDGT